jgi:multiple sugar transport system ATP-binding protein
MNMLDGRITESGWEKDDVAIDFDPANYGLSVGDEVTMGIRPEDIQVVGREETAKKKTDAISAIVDVIEPIGHETFVYLLLSKDVEVNLEEGAGSNRLLMSVSEEVNFTEGQEVKVVFDLENVHLFDSKTGDAIIHGLFDHFSSGEMGSGEVGI